MERRLRAALAERKNAFCDRYQLRHPILLPPMAGACPPGLSIAVVDAGGLGACGALHLQREEMRVWADDFRSATSGPFQIISGPRTHRPSAMPCRRRNCLLSWNDGKLRFPVVQGVEAGGHRGCLEASRAEAGMVGLFSLIPAVAVRSGFPSLPPAASRRAAVWQQPSCSVRRPPRSAPGSCVARKRTFIRHGRTPWHEPRPRIRS